MQTSLGHPSRLADIQKNKLAQFLLKGEMAHGYRTEWWSTARVVEIIQKMFDVMHDRDHVGRILHGMGFSCQKPYRKVLERHAPAVLPSIQPSPFFCRDCCIIYAEVNWLWQQQLLCAAKCQLS